MKRACLAFSLVLPLAACGSAGETPAPAPATSSAGARDVAGGDAAAGARPSGKPPRMTREGRLEQGAECPVLHTPDGEIYAISLGDTGFAPGDYVRVTGELADASYCMQGKGTLIPARIEAATPPARDRDPARAGGLAVTTEYVRGGWTAKGGDCRKPDFDVTLNANGMAIIETRINGVPATGAISVGSRPALHFDAPLPALPIETRGPDGLAVMPPGSGEVVTLAGHAISGDGVVFINCG